MSINGTTDRMISTPYTANWRAFVRAGVKASARVMVPVFYEHLKPQSVIDVGAGEGWFLKEFQRCGVRELVALDNDATVSPREIRYIGQDLNEPLVIAERFDLCLCLEVAEHLRPESADTLVNSLCALSDRIVFSAAIPGQGGAGHVNEQWASWWIEKFKARGYVASDYFRWMFWDNPNVEPWYSQNLIYFFKRSREDFRIVHDVVHPRLWSEKMGL